MENEEKQKKEKLYTVSIVKQKGASALVEWSDGKRLRRAYIPAIEIENDKCKESVLEAGIQYGADWEKYIDKVTVTPGTIADALRNAGFWTPEDIECRVKNAQGVIARLLDVNAALLARKARNDK